MMVAEEALSSPKNRLKFLCSYGGKILPKPLTGQLKYVGGETRVVVVPRNINFSELMKKLTSLFDADVILKYQLLPEDLEALVSVTCDEDLNHMLEEYDRHEARSSETSGAPRLRAFLFPTNPITVESNACDPQVAEQRYIDALNGIVRTSSRTSFTSLSACSSPRSLAPDAYYADNVQYETNFMCNGYGDQSENLTRYHNNLTHDLPKVHSSPSLVNLANNNYHPHQNHNQSRLGRLAPPPLMIVRNDNGRPQAGQMQRGYQPQIGLQRKGSGGWPVYANGDQVGLQRKGSGGMTGYGTGDHVVIQRKGSGGWAAYGNGEGCGYYRESPLSPG